MLRSLTPAGQTFSGKHGHVAYAEDVDYSKSDRIGIKISEGNREMTASRERTTCFLSWL